VLSDGALRLKRHEEEVPMKTPLSLSSQYKLYASCANLAEGEEEGRR